MKKFNVLSIVIICFVVIIYHKTNADEVCNAEALRKFDSNIAKLVTVGNSGRRFPENKGAELKKFCSQSAKYIFEIDSYKNQCFPSRGKQIVNVLIYALRNIIKQLCNKDSQRLTNLIEATPCANTGNAEINKCYTRLIDDFLGIQHADHKLKIPMVCCTYHKLSACIPNRLKRIERCTQDNISNIMEFIKSITGNAIDLLCSDYAEGSDKCSKLEGPPKKKKSQRRTKSFALPLIDVLNSFPDE